MKVLPGATKRPDGIQDTVQIQPDEEIQEDPQIPFPPNGIGTTAERSKPVGRTVERTPLFEGYFDLHALRSADGTLLGLDWRKAPQPGQEPSVLDPKTAIVTAIASVDGELCGVFGQSSPRLCNLLRGRPYVQLSPPGGRVDKVLTGPDGEPLSELETGVQIGLTEVEEETGGRIVEGLYRPLHDGWTPTCAALTSEADRAVGAVIVLPPDAASVGDGGKMEITDARPKTFSLVLEALRLAREGRINEAVRWEPYLREFLEQMGYHVELGCYAHELPGASGQSKDDRLTRDLIARYDQPSPDEKTKEEVSPNFAVVKHVNNVQRVDDDHVIFDLIVSHAHRDEAGKVVEVGDPHPNIILHTSYDLAKCVEFYVDDIAGPMVRLRDAERPALADPEKEDARAPILKDVGEVRIDLPFHGESPEALIEQAAKMDFSAIAKSQVEAEAGGPVFQLGAPDVASVGQSDLQWHFFASQIDRPNDRSDFVPLSRALELCADSEASTKAALWRLADHLGWFVSKNAWVESYEKRAGIDGPRPKLI